MSQTESGNPLVYLFKKLWHYSEGNRKNIVLYWCMFILSQSINLLMIPLVWTKIMVIITKEGVKEENFYQLVVLLGLSLARSPLFWGLHVPARVLEKTNAFKARINYRKYLLKGVMTMPFEWHTDHHSGDTIDKIEKGTNGLYKFAEESHNSIYGLVQLVGSICVVAYFIHWPTLLVVGFIVLSTWITVQIDKILIPQYQELNRSENRISESIFDAISNISTVITLRKEGPVFDSIVHKLEEPYRLFKKNSLLSEIKWFLASLCCNAMIVVVVLVYILRNFGSNPGVLVGSFYMITNYLDQISELFFAFAGSYSDIIQRRAKVRNAEELSKDFKPENFTNHVLPKEWQRVDVKGLNFSYSSEKGAELNLKDVSFSFERGERIALVGKSGGGKSTILQVMCDVIHPQSIELLVDGQIVPEGFGGIARATTLALQQAELFAKSVEWNITFGADHTLEFVQCFTDMACCTDVIDNLPTKLESIVREKGVNLSGGQRQRVALARALMACHGKDIVLLDEPTSSLDVETEMKVFQNIFTAFEGKTIFSSVHRLNLLPYFDRVFMFKEGRLIAQGTLVELLSDCAEFQELWQHYLRSMKSSSAAGE